jgi:Tol biopolymer transport system component
VELLNVATLESRSLPPPAAECGSTMGAAFSPDGLSLASVCLVSQGRFAIFVGPVSGKGARKLAMVHGGIHRLGYAPDGRHLVYDNRGSVWRLPVTGGAPEALLADRDATSPVLARGGGRLAYVQAVSNDNLWRVRLSERSRAAAPPESFLSSSRRSHSYPAFSRDGRRIAFGSDRSGTGEIWVCNADGSDPVQLTSFRGPETGTPVWSFDGSEVVFDSRPDGDAQLFAVRADGGVPRPIDTGIPNSSQPSFSGDGRWLYFVGGHESAIQIYKRRYPGGPTVAITTQGGVWPRESADGQRVFYARSGALWSASIAGGDERAEARFPAGSSWGWVPAPGGLYLIDRSGPQAALAFFDLATRRVHRIVEVPRASLWQAIAISPDGRSILYSQRDTDIADIMLVEGID